MKKILKKSYILTVFTLVFFILVGCFAEVAHQVSRIEITRIPETTFVVSAVTPSIQFEIKAVNSDGTEVTSINQSTSGVTLSNFSTSKVGTYTATIKYEGSSVQFTYYVVESSGFLGGDGSLETPYLIANAKQFLNIPNTREKLEGLSLYAVKKNFKLVADINFEYVSQEDISSYNNAILSTWFMGSIDGLKSVGKKYKLINYVSDTPMFYRVMDATFSNFDLEDCIFTGLGEVDYGAILTYGPGANINWGTYSIKNQINFLDVDVLAGCESTTSSYMVYAGMQTGPNTYTKVLFENCENYATMKGSSLGSAPFGWNIYGAQLIKCTNYGDVYGTAETGAFLTMGANKFVDCVNEGDIYYLGSGTNIHMFTISNGSPTYSGCVNRGTVYVGTTNTVSMTKFDVNCTNEADPKVSKTLVSFASNAIIIDESTRAISFTQLTGEYTYKISLSYNSDYYLVNQDGTTTFSTGGYPRNIVTWDYQSSTTYTIPYVYQVLPEGHGITSLPKYAKEAPINMTQSGIASDGNFYHLVQEAEFLNLISGSFTNLEKNELKVYVTVKAYNGDTFITDTIKEFNLIYPNE